MEKDKRCPGPAELAGVKTPSKSSKGSYFLSCTWPRVFPQHFAGLMLLWTLSPVIPTLSPGLSVPLLQDCNVSYPVLIPEWFKKLHEGL
jgi:hypothetical protein